MESSEVWLKSDLPVATEETMEISEVELKNDMPVATEETIEKSEVELKSDMPVATRETMENSELMLKSDLSKAFEETMERSKGESDLPLTSKEIIESSRGEFDLPLSSNTDQIKVNHYVIVLHCDLDKKEIQGNITFFLKFKTDAQEADNIIPGSTGLCSNISKTEEKLCTHFESVKEIKIQENGLASAPWMQDTTSSQFHSLEPEIGQSTPNIDIIDVSKNVCKCSVFEMILDCHKMNISNVTEIHIPSSAAATIDLDPCYLTTIERDGEELCFCVDEHSVKVSKSIKHEEDIPKAIRITYTTRPDGPSLKWTKDQDGKDCVYTHGHWINNRSLFPSQDVPDALATWKAYIHVSHALTVLMSGDEDPVCFSTSTGMKCYYYWTDFAMPSSTLSLAIGHWTQVSEDQSVRIPKCVIPCRVFGPNCLKELLPLILDYLVICLQEVTDILGSHPMKRQDILLVPSCFDSLGMASPSVLYLSQSLLHKDLSMFYRLAHEVCHTWFGVVIGPADWTEEWLTEGFCTYLEDIIHHRVMIKFRKMNMEDEESYRGLRDLIKYRILESELDNTTEDLQKLRPNAAEDSNKSKKYIQNGMNPDKQFLQVHYLKGYFLLRYLEKICGTCRFMQCIKNYVQRFHGKLVTSKEVLEFFLEDCTELRDAGMSVRKISEEWLDYPGQSPAMELFVSRINDLKITKVKEQIKIFKGICKTYKKLRRRNTSVIDKISKMEPDELMLFLELLLDEDRIPAVPLHQLHKKCDIKNSNAEIQHRWCELVIKHKVERFYGEIQSFLTRHQGMGVYLFGELMVSRNEAQRRLAHMCFDLIKDTMSRDRYRVVHAMLYGE